MRSPLERSRYAQVALTYTKPWPMRLWAALTTLGVMWMLGTAFVQKVHHAVQSAMLGTNVAGGDRGLHLAMLFLAGSMAAWVGAMIAAHLKEQIADARSSLVPGFRGPHLIVAAIMFTAFAVGFPAVVAAAQAALEWYDVWPPGYLAVVLAVTAMLAWMGHLQTPVALLLVGLMVSPVFFAGGRGMLSDVVGGRAVATGYALLALSVAALLALWWRLAVMHEEMPEYARSVSPGLRLKVRMTGDPLLRGESAAGASPVEAWVRKVDRLDDVANVAAAGFWRRVAHWRVVIGMGRMAAAVALLLGAWTFLLPTLAPRKTATVLPIVLSAIVPGLMVAAVWPRRWYVLGDESLRPASRRQFVREQGAAMALELATTWLAITAATFAAGLLLDRSNASASPLWRTLPVLAAGQALTFGIIVWILRYRSGWLVIVPMLLAALLGVVVLGVAVASSRVGDVRSPLAAAAVFAALGLAIAFDAYRRWLVTEFD